MNYIKYSFLTKFHVLNEIRAEKERLEATRSYLENGHELPPLFPSNDGNINIYCSSCGKFVLSVTRIVDIPVDTQIGCPCKK